MCKKSHIEKPKQRQDLHHLCFQRELWCGGATGALRKYHYCKMYIPKCTLHAIIHAKVLNIPPPQANNAKAVLRKLIYLERHGDIGPADSLEKRLEVLSMLFERSEPPTANAFKEQLNIVREYSS